MKEAVFREQIIGGGEWLENHLKYVEQSLAWWSGKPRFEGWERAGQVQNTEKRNPLERTAYAKVLRQKSLGLLKELKGDKDGRKMGKEERNRLLKQA